MDQIQTSSEITLWRKETNGMVTEASETRSGSPESIKVGIMTVVMMMDTVTAMMMV